ncbi:antibiotic biosynthesis monooxygenase [Pseudoxanthomonas yeongjuensis]|uniref:putative quinol monooxygenase n=1 Tax=Pseudoxanthomonas yeongjuensis TaxID=377616 RepID=UPI0013919660|nr:antibiotic biosynthesis monooxygenase [Pseudoxanthomonas yeongjuensis]KAF1716935.1 antibiotic biosynthesis monooxygenase [Pseudoxanthomonas yeongjuensis]
MNPYGLASKVNALPGQRENLVEVLLEISRLVLHGDGCLSHVVSIVPDDDDAIFITEYWLSHDAHRTVFALPGLFELMNQCQALAAGFEQTELRPLNN